MKKIQKQMKIYIYASDKAFGNSNSSEAKTIKFTLNVRQIDENGQRILFEGGSSITSIITPSLRFTNKNHKAIYLLEELNDSQIQKLINYWWNL